MRGPGEVLLVSTYELGHAPMGLAWPAAALRRAAFEPAVLDLALEPFDPERVARARLVAMSVPMHTALRLATRAAARIRSAAPSAFVAFHGLYAGLNAEHLLAAGLADAVISGECEEPLVALAEALAAGRDPEVPGVSTLRRPTGPWLGRAALPVPLRTGLPPASRYAALVDAEGRSRLAGYSEASRGCKHRCRHCPVVPVYGGRFFAVPLDTVLGDVRQQVEAGATHITFGDPDFLNGPEHARRLARALRREHPGLSFDFTAKVEHLLAHPDLVAELRRCGAAFVVSAFESLSDLVLSRLDKGHTRADLERVVDLLAAAGLPVRPTFVPYTPWTTLDDLVELVEWIADRDLLDAVEPVQLALRLLVPPGSRLLELPPAGGGEWPGPLDREGFQHRWRHADPRLDELQARSLARVERGIESGEDPRDTHRALADLVRAAAGSAPRDAARVPARRPRPPRLTEAWFC